MIKAEYLGYKLDELQTGKVYKITTYCARSLLIVRCRDITISYHNLEQFLKDWKVRAVCSE